MLLAFYPPWIVVEDTSKGVTTYKTRFFGYASIWEPPSTEALRGATVEVDIARLLLEDLGALVPIAILWFCSAPFRREMEKNAQAREAMAKMSGIFDQSISDPSPRSNFPLYEHRPFRGFLR